MIPCHCHSQFLPLVPLTPELCEKEQLLCVTPASGPQQKFAGKLIGHNQERKAYIFSPIGDLGRGDVTVLNTFKIYKCMSLLKKGRRMEWNSVFNMGSAMC